MSWCLSKTTPLSKNTVTQNSLRLMPVSMADCYHQKEKQTVTTHPGNWMFYGDRRTKKCRPSATQTNRFKLCFPRVCETRAL